MPIVVRAKSWLYLVYPFQGGASDNAGLDFSTSFIDICTNTRSNATPKYPLPAV